MHGDWHVQACCSMFAKFPEEGENSIESSVAHRPFYKLIITFIFGGTNRFILHKAAIVA